MITLSGLTPKQMALCDIMWSLESQAGVDAFIKTLPLAEARECRSLIQLMIMEFVDEVTDTRDAQAVLNQFKL